MRKTSPVRSNSCMEFGLIMTRCALRHESRIIINGCDLSGILCIAMLRKKGYESIIAIDSRRSNLKMAKKAGAESVIYAGEQTEIKNILESIHKIFWGNLADLIFCFNGMTDLHLKMSDQFVHANGCYFFVCDSIQRERLNGKLLNRLLEKEVIVLQNKKFTNKDYTNALNLIENDKIAVTIE